MRKIVSTTVVMLFFLLTDNESVVAQSGKQKIDFDYPDDIVDTAKKRFVSDFNKGQKIYTVTCGSCHNKTIAGKTVIPDFSLPQLMDYEMRMSPDHGENLTDRFISDDEMQRVIIFLRYKKKSGVDVRPGPKVNRPQP